MKAERVLRAAARGSRLSSLQAEQVVSLLRQSQPEIQVRLLSVTTQGDLQRDIPLAEIPAPDGVFTRGVEAELLAGRADFAVHSLKDLPTLMDPQLVLAAIPARADARDVLLSRRPGGIDQLPSGATVGTSSPRRSAQVLARRPDLIVVSIRGNVDTRVRKLRAGEVDALVLAAAGLHRLGLAAEIAEYLPVELFTPPAGQGALAVQCRANDPEMRKLLETIDDAAARASVTAERTFLRALGGGCRMPIGANAEARDGHLRLVGFLAAPDGRYAQSAWLDGPMGNPEAIGTALAEKLLARADRALIAQLRHA